MNAVTVKREDLIDRLTANRVSHHDLFLRAQKGFRKRVIEELDQALKDAREGKKIRRRIDLPEPIDRTDDYDAALEMLHMSVDDEIDISEYDFKCYVLDKWDWAAQAYTTNVSYTGDAT